MFFANKMIEPKEVNISQVSEEFNFLRIRGKITEVSVSKSGTTFLKVKDDSGIIDVVIFKNSMVDMPDAKAGEFVEVLGKPQKYKGKLEIIATQIKR